MRAAGCGLGSAGFIVFGEPTDMVAVAAGIAPFLSVESCGQCTPCKTDGAELHTLLDRLARSSATAADVETIERRIRTVDHGARCNLGNQQATVLASLLDCFRDEFDAHLTGRLPPVPPVLVSELVDIRDGHAAIDEHHHHKQPDWTFATTSSGATPADRRSRYR
jgi:NADH-quinone oxidoreductase subunit F